LARLERGGIVERPAGKIRLDVVRILDALCFLRRSAELQILAHVPNLSRMTTDIFQFLSEHRIHYERLEHPPVFTCEEAEQLVPPMPGVQTKNLFVRDKKGRRHILVVVDRSKSVDLKALSSAVGVTNLSLASSERLNKYLGIEAGAVSLLALVNDVDGTVEVVLDADVWKADILQCHPLVNTSTLAMHRSDIERILEITDHRWTVLAIPEIDR